MIIRQQKSSLIKLLYTTIDISSMLVLMQKKRFYCGLKTWHSNASLPLVVTVFASITKGCHKSERILLWIAIVFCFALLQFQGK